MIHIEGKAMDVVKATKEKDDDEPHLQLFADCYADMMTTTHSSAKWFRGETKITYHIYDYIYGIQLTTDS